MYRRLWLLLACLPTAFALTPALSHFFKALSTPKANNAFAAVDAPADVLNAAATEPRHQLDVLDGVEVAATRNNILPFPKAPPRRSPPAAAAEAPAAPPRPCAFTPAALQGTDKRDYDAELRYPELAARYHADPRIHGFGNTGPMGVVHALVAPTFTSALDTFAYGGLDTRSLAWDRVDRVRRKHGGAVAVKSCADLGTGTGTTARALRKRYLATVTGVDTSPEMLRAARDLTHTGALDLCHDVAYKRHNAEATGLAAGSADVVAVFFLLHEAPAVARRRILREARRLAAPGGTVVVCDIHPDFQPSPMMLSGEPYINGYLDHIDGEAGAFAKGHDFAHFDRHVVYEGRLVLWTFQLPPP